MDEPVAGGGVGSSLSLTGYLSLQERKEKKGRLVPKRGSPHRYWFWFDEKDCVLKYYKSQDSYKQYLHNPLGTIDMDNARVTPAAAHDDTNSSTFIISTKNQLHYGLSAESDDICHRWIKKLQVKRSEWIKKERTLKTQPMHYGRGAGLVNEGGKSELSRSAISLSTSSQMRQLFYDYLEKKSVSSGYEDPFEKWEKNRSGTAKSLPSYSSVVSTDDQDGGDKQDSYESNESGKSSEEAIGSNLTEQEKLILELRCELSETRSERNKLQKQVLKLEEELASKDTLNKSLFDDLDRANELNHKMSLPQSQFIQENSNLKSVNENLQKSLKSLNGEVELHKLHLEAKNKDINVLKDRVIELERELLVFKSKYVMLLSDSFKIPTPSPSGLAMEELDPFEEKLKGELIQLIQDETTSENPLYEITTNKFEDQFGELHDWKGDSNICHFLCRHLYLHFTESGQESLCNLWYRYLNNMKKVKERHYEIPTERGKRRELRNYLRKGIPHQFRSQMWSSLVYSQISKMKEVKDSTAAGGSYYQSLLSVTSACQKQIYLDLYRTLPSNKHFKQGGSGSDKLQRVLMAYSNHNKNIGYCQGMNMIAAIGLLYLDEETTFWYLVAALEKLMPTYYYSHGLAAAQADQIIMKNLLQEKLPTLYEYLELHGADVSIVTFNWFLTFFIDALPTESMLRIMDCFLLEGRKLFFRFSLAIFKQYQRRLTSMSDPVTIFQFMKEVARHIFNVEELFHISFYELERFPSRGQLNSRCQNHVEKFKSEWQEREKQKEEARASRKTVLPSIANQNSLRTKVLRKQLQWECACVVNEGEVWLCCGERQVGKLCIVSASKDGFETTSPSLDIKSKVLCIKPLSNNIVMVGTLDFTLHSINAVTKKELWSMKMNDSILDFVGVDDTLLCALADGYIAVLPTNGEFPPTSDPVHYRIGNTAVQCFIHTPYNHIWCGCGKAITVISAKTHEPINPIIMSDNCGKVYKMELGSHGVWVTFRSSTMICLFDAEHMIKLIEVDYVQLLRPDMISDPSFNKSDHRVIVATPMDDQLWVGTGNATIFIFTVNPVVMSPTDSINAIAAQQYQENMSTFERSMQKPQSSDDSCLVNMEKTLSPVRVTDTSISTRRRFGKTFRHQIKREVSQDVKKLKIYDLSCLSSSRVLPESQECSRVTILKPIKRNGKLFVISCVNSVSAVEKAVQLWQCASSKSPSNWNYTCIPECYDCIVKEVTPPIQSSLDKARTYSTVFGTIPSLPDDIPPAPVVMSST